MYICLKGHFFVTDKDFSCGQTHTHRAMLYYNNEKRENSTKKEGTEQWVNASVTLLLAFWNWILKNSLNQNEKKEKELLNFYNFLFISKSNNFHLSKTNSVGRRIHFCSLFILGSWVLVCSLRLNYMHYFIQFLLNSSSEPH